MVWRAFLIWEGDYLCCGNDSFGTRDGRSRSWVRERTWQSCLGLASGLLLYLVKEVIGLVQSEGGCHAVHTVSRVDGAGPLLRYAG